MQGAGTAEHGCARVPDDDRIVESNRFAAADKLAHVHPCVSKAYHRKPVNVDNLASMVGSVPAESNHASLRMRDGSHDVET